MNGMSDLSALWGAQKLFTLSEVRNCSLIGGSRKMIRPQISCGGKRRLAVISQSCRVGRRHWAFNRRSMSMLGKPSPRAALRQLCRIIPELAGG
jgi:hypothetical protein